MANGFSSSGKAEELAQIIYDRAVGCLMAHSIRAVEKHLREQYEFDTQIVLDACPHVRSDTGRLSWCSVAQHSGHITYIRYWDDKDLGHNHKRFCVAHELYHIIWSVASSSAVPREVRSEQVCDHFANELCKKHDKFYEEQAKKNNGDIRFHGLPLKSV